MALKVVLDTNVLISGLTVAAGPSARILDAAQKGDLILTTSAQLLREFGEVVARPRIARKYPKVTENAELILDYLRTHVTLVKGEPAERIVTDDPDDDVVIASAVEGDVDYIVTGDEHLLKLAQHKHIRIVSPAQFVAIAFETEDKSDQ